MEKNGELVRAFERNIFSMGHCCIPAEFRLPNVGEEIVVRTCGNVFRGGSGKVAKVFPMDGVFVAKIGGVVARYVKDAADQRYWKCEADDDCMQTVTAFIAVCGENGRFMMLCSP